MNYSHIADAVEFYTSRGYAYEPDAPWYVDSSAYVATRPAGATDIHLQVGNGASDGYPVASGEQSFIQMMLDGQPLKRAICVTPCWRWEPRPDVLRRRTFMKAEIINAQDVDEAHLVHMIHEASTFFERYVDVRVIKTLDGFDIVEKTTRLELGSYGIRELVVAKQDLRWIYGTACAEPRLSTVIARVTR